MATSETAAGAQIAIHLNGTEKQVPAGCTIAKLLELEDVRTHLIAVEVNLCIIPRTQHADYELQSGDTIEMVTLVGGG